MPIITVVEDYIFAALKRAVGDEFEDGSLAATIPEFPGIIAYGADAHECVRELYSLLDETVRIWLAGGYRLPVIDGIDLNSDKGQILASYHPHATTKHVDGTIYQDEHELETAFEARDKSA